MSNNYKKLTALITGASYGLGYEFAKVLAELKIDLVIVSRNENKLQQVKHELEEKYQINVHTIPLDLSKNNSAETLFNKCEENNLNIDILINNAGIGLFGKIIDNKPEDIENIINLNILTPTKLCKLFGEKMAKNRYGFILNVASMASLISIPYFSIYSATKNYILSYSISLRNELKDNYVSVTCLLPGYIRTNFDNNARITSEKYKNFSKKIGMDPKKVAKIGIHNMFKKKIIVIPGVMNKLLSIVLNFIPKNSLSSLIKFIIKKII